MIKKQHNPFDEMSDEEFLNWREHCGHIEPKWEDCTKEEYEANVPKPFWDESKEYSEYDKMMAVLFDSCNYRKIPIFNGGLLDQARGKATVIGYNYQKIVGTQRVFVCGSQMADWIYQREQQIKKRK